MSSLLARLQAAAQNPDADSTEFVLANIDTILFGKPPELRRLLEAAAVPYTWDAAQLKQLVVLEQQRELDSLMEQLCRLPIVLQLPNSDRFAVHDVSRTALRQQLHREGRLDGLARRVLRALGPAQSTCPATDLVERLYHQLVAEPEFGANALEAQWQQWRIDGRYAELNLLAASLEELLPQLSLPARAMSLLVWSAVKGDRVAASAVAERAHEAEGLFERWRPSSSGSSVRSLR